MKSTFTIFAFLISTASISLLAQVPVWNWAHGAGSIYYELATGVTYDNNGYLLVTGYFSSPTLGIGSVQLTNNSLANMGDIFVAKYDPAGNLIWARSYGAQLDESPGDIACDASGNIYVTGMFNSDPWNIGSSTLQCTDPWGDSADVFIAAFDPSGNPLWAHSATGMGLDEGVDIETDAQGNVYVMGDFDSDTIRFGTQYLVNCASGNAYDAFLVKYNSAGAIQWARSIAGSDYEFSRGLSVDTAGNIVVAGCSSSDSVVTSTGVLTNNSQGSGTLDVFVVKYNSSGLMLWSRMFGGNSSDDAGDVDTDPNGNIFVGGSSYSSFFIFASDSFINSSALTTDIFLVKFDGQGNQVWVISAGGINHDGINTVSCDNWSNIFVGGGYSPVAYFGNDSLVTSSGPTDMFVALYDQSGSATSLLTAGGAGGEGIAGLACDIGGGVYAVGAYSSATCMFGPTTLPFAGWNDMFIAKWSVTWTGITGQDELNGSRIYPNPCIDFVHVVVEDAADGIAEVFGTNGQLVLKTSVKEGDNRIPVTGLSSGVYLLRLTTNNGTTVQRIVKSGLE